MKNTYIYLGFIAPSHIAEKGQTSSVSGNNAEINFITKVLAKITDKEKINIMSYQYNLYFKNIYGTISKENFDINENGVSIKNCYPLANNREMLFSKIRVIFEIITVLNRLTKHIIKKNKSKPILITVNTYPIFSVPAILISKRYNLKLATYLIDGYYDIESKNIIRKINAKWASKLLKHYDYAIALCQNILDDYGTNKQNSLSITPVMINNYYENNNCLTDGIKLFFAGGVAPLNGIREYIDAMSYLDEKYSLDIYGVGELVEFVKEKGNLDNRICYCGLKSNDKIRILEAKSHILLIVRSDDVYFNSQIKRYGIPYKVLEYLQSGTPIIASEMESVPQELRQFINICDPDGKSIADMVLKITNNYDYYKNKALLAREYMKENCTWENCKDRIQNQFGW